jgi:sec-independent protein translocase protein TatB
MGLEMIFIFLLALILFGPKRLPEMAREVGKFVAEFKRASNDFKYQLQSEIEKAGTDAVPPPQPGAQPAVVAGAQQTNTFTQTLLPPAVTSVASEMESAHERLMKTARMAFDAQNYTLRPPEPPPAATSPEPDPSSAQPSEQSAQPASRAASHESFPVGAETDHATPDSATANSNSAPQRS